MEIIKENNEVRSNEVKLEHPLNKPLISLQFVVLKFIIFKYNGRRN